MPCQLRLGSSDDMCGVETEMRLGDLARRREPERTHADDRAAAAHITLPAQRRGLFDATRALTSGGSTLLRYSSLCCSKRSHDGMLTTRAAMPSAFELLVGVDTQRLTSLPVPSSSTSGSSVGRVGEHVRAPGDTARRCVLLAVEGRQCLARQSTMHEGRSTRRITTRHASRLRWRRPGAATSSPACHAARRVVRSAGASVRPRPC